MGNDDFMVIINKTCSVLNLIKIHNFNESINATFSLSVQIRIIIYNPPHVFGYKTINTINYIK